MWSFPQSMCVFMLCSPMWGSLSVSSSPMLTQASTRWERPQSTVSESRSWHHLWHSFLVFSLKGECQVPAEWEAFQLHHTEEFPRVYEAVRQPAEEETHRADAEDGKVRERTTETADYGLTGQKMYTMLHLCRSACVICPLSVILQHYTYLFLL